MVEALPRRDLDELELGRHGFERHGEELVPGDAADDLGAARRPR
jgi:hypothetical protein